ncbi:MAG: DoxX family protein [Candidatus Pacebacteria bacterium]|nr:DoxX family protein [Candidatus Paceibacterota bacterium]
MMMNESQRKTLGSTGILVARSLIGLFFLLSGYGMFTAGQEAISGFFASVGVPFAALAYWPVVILKIGAGLALILGYRVGLAASGLIGFTLLATYFGHSDWEDPMNLTAVTKNLAVVGGLLYVMAYGAGTGWKLKK